jgi:hypothetical protein
MGLGVALRWDQVDPKAGLLHIAKLQNGIASMYPIRALESRAANLRLTRSAPMGHILR